MDNDKDIRLIIRPDRKIRVTEDGQTTLYHIRGIVDVDHVVVRHYDRNRWKYKLIHMKAFEIRYKAGMLS
jgi:hypothetical protein